MATDFDRLVEELQQQIIEQARAVYSDKVIEEFYHPKNLGRMHEPDAHAIRRGWCGDTRDLCAVQGRQDREGCFHDRWLRANGGLWEYPHSDGDGDVASGGQSSPAGTFGRRFRWIT